MVEVCKFEDAPRSIQSVSTLHFGEVDCIIGDTEDEVWSKTQEVFFAAGDLLDYDITFDNVSGKWVGFTCV